MDKEYEKRYEGYKWIKVKRFQDNPDLSYEERFKLLEKHHIKETQFLIEEIRGLARFIDCIKK